MHRRPKGFLNFLNSRNSKIPAPDIGENWLRKIKLYFRTSLFSLTNSTEFFQKSKSVAQETTARREKPKLIHDGFQYRIKKVSGLVLFMIGEERCLVLTTQSNMNIFPCSKQQSPSRPRFISEWCKKATEDILAFAGRKTLI